MVLGRISIWCTNKRLAKINLSKAFFLIWNIVNQFKQGFFPYLEYQRLLKLSSTTTLCRQRKRAKCKRLLQNIALQNIACNLQQECPKFFFWGPHKLLHNSSKPGRLTWCDCIRLCYILPNQQIFRKYCTLFFHLWQNDFADRKE